MLDEHVSFFLPFTLEQVERAWLWSVADATLAAQTKGEMATRILVNEDTERDGVTGRYTRKQYDLRGKLPLAIRMLVPDRYQQFEEEAFNAFPKCTTYITHPELGRDRFSISIETDHVVVPGGVRVDKRVVLHIDFPFGEKIEKRVWSQQRAAFERVYRHLEDTVGIWNPMTAQDIFALEQKVAETLNTF